jgi:hypothetical protein
MDTQLRETITGVELVLIGNNPFNLGAARVTALAGLSSVCRYHVNDAWRRIPFGRRLIRRPRPEVCRETCQKDDIQISLLGDK